MGVVSNNWADSVLLSALHMFNPSYWPMFKPRTWDPLSSPQQQVSQAGLAVRWGRALTVFHVWIIFRTPCEWYARTIFVSSMQRLLCLPFLTLHRPCVWGAGSVRNWLWATPHAIRCCSRAAHHRPHSQNGWLVKECSASRLHAHVRYTTSMYIYIYIYMYIYIYI